MDAITFVMQGRRIWFHGICIGQEVFEMQPDNGQEVYMDQTMHQILTFGTNHWDISGGNPGGFPSGHRFLTKIFKKLLTERGRLNPLLFGPFAVYLCEAPRYEIIFQHLSAGMVKDSVGRLDKTYLEIDDIIRNWQNLSAFIMNCLICKQKGYPLPKLEGKIAFEGLNSLEDVIDLVRILQLEALDEKNDLFCPEPMELPDKWTASADKLVRRLRNNSKQKKRSAKRKQLREDVEPALPESFPPHS